MLPIRRRERSEVEKLVNRLHRGFGQKPYNVVVFTSIEPGSHCSWLCVHTGDLLAASTDGSVCLVDANLGSPSLHQQMHVVNRRGLADLLIEPTLHLKDVALRLNGRELCLITCGSVSNEDSGSLSQSDRMRERIAELRSSFDYVLIDAPAVSVCNGALTLGQVADGVVLVVRAGSTRRDAARRLTGELMTSGVNVIGAILSDYAAPIPARIEKWL